MKQILNFSGKVWEFRLWLQLLRTLEHIKEAVDSGKLVIFPGAPTKGKVTAVDRDWKPEQ